ncbi:MAG: hypothetical protein Q8M31_21760 [Beijerinckiaceae bacterium]|nr:hypothetical protein [Beijerinckiaceae bacterium]
MIDLDRLNDLEAQLQEPDAELRQIQDQLLAAYVTRRSRIVIDLNDLDSIRRRAEIREIMDENRIAFGKLRSERDRLRRAAKAEERASRETPVKQGRAA